MTQAEMLQEIETLRAQNEALKARVESGRKGGVLTLKVSTKGAVSVYGLGRWPLTLYREQMIRLLDYSNNIRTFIENNTGKLATKQAA